MLTDAPTIPCLPDAVLAAGEPQVDGPRAFAQYRDGGGEQAFQHLLLAYLPSVRHICRRILGYSAMAEDAVQETFIKTARHAHTVTGDPGAWIRACALNCSLSLRRSERSRHRREQVYAEGVPLITSTPEEPAWEQALVLSCLSQVSDQDRHVLVEHFLMGRSQTDIAADLGVSQVAVHKRIARALAALRIRIIASGAADGLRALAATRPDAGNACVVPDPFTWLLVAVASSRRGRLMDALLRPIAALVSALTLGQNGVRYHASCVRHSWPERLLGAVTTIARETTLHLDPRLWRQRDMRS